MSPPSSRPRPPARAARIADKAPAPGVPADTGEAQLVQRTLSRYRRARDRRSLWESSWRECYDYALPHRESMFDGQYGGKRYEHLFDGTAPDAVDQLAASLLAELTPPWARWFGLEGGPGLSEDERATVQPLLQEVASTALLHFDRSSFAVEIHQCFLDLVTAGTAALLFEEAGIGENSAFRFTAIPLANLVVEEGPSGRLDTVFRRYELTLSLLQERFPAALLPEEIHRQAARDEDCRLAVVESIIPDGNGYASSALLLGLAAGGYEGGEAVLLDHRRLAQSPFLVFRWLKAPGEAYGRSPVMKALPDIKTANKVVELILKNASISVTGIWQADDDGVLNPANIKLVPGAIIPKAVGSSGLTPLEAPGRFDVSQLVLEDLRNRIRHALLADRLAQVNSARMTATEVLERSSEMARLLGATYGRLQSELLTPLVMRAVSILRRRGEIPDIRVDGRLVDVQYRSPLARQQTQQDASSALTWLEAIRALGVEAAAAVDPVVAARWLGRALGVPAELMSKPAPPAGGNTP